MTVAVAAFVSVPDDPPWQHATKQSAVDLRLSTRFKTQKKATPKGGLLLL
jgi:hypothetical protein